MIHLAMDSDRQEGGDTMDDGDGKTTTTTTTTAGQDSGGVGRDERIEWVHV
ncbi:hypothetical protein E2C01_102107 [Portunus trituberculatus]|uniref:Uncharacterized protein n=1 Tax=Portunus trituberculatus TaxID=210409 RepID=A0A5B7K7A0_PORTR|nr:hypothetical protein [Portunus trituberculatus]